jgi:hypothetical protein
MERQLKFSGQKVTDKSSKDYGTMVVSNASPKKKRKKAPKTVTNYHLLGTQADVTKDFQQKIEHVPNREVE